MICTEFYDGQGLGNQLWVYAVCRSLAEKKGCPFAILSPERFHGKKFITLDYGEKLEGVGSVPNPNLPSGITNYYAEKYIWHNGMDVTVTDQGLINVPLNTKIDGVMQSPAYLSSGVRNWIKVKAPHVTDACVIHVRMGDYRTTEAFLSKEYFIRAMNVMSAEKYVCISDDPHNAAAMLGIPCISSTTPDQDKASHHIGGDVAVDFSYILNAPSLIIPNSSFSWWAAYLNPHRKIIAPKYWAGWRREMWSTGSIETKEFIYV